MKRVALIIVVAGAAATCSRGDDVPDAARPNPMIDSGSRARPVTTEVLPPQDSALKSAALNVIDFLRGLAPHDSVRFDDTVELLVPAEGGGARRRVSREALSDRTAWFVESQGQRYSFVPPAGLTQIRVLPGRHFNCVEVALASRVPGLATAPHVGVRLEPSRAESCLQGWNATFVFDTTSGRPRLRAAVYDQWEW